MGYRCNFVVIKDSGAYDVKCWKPFIPSYLYSAITLLYFKIAQIRKHRTMTLLILDITLRIILVVATGILFSVALAAYLRLKNRRLLFLSAGFGIFFAHAIIYLPAIIGSSYVISETSHLMIHLVALIFILIGTLKD